MASPGAKSFHLRWNNHLTNLRSLLESLYNDQNLVDVTLSCSDGTLKAHKLMLSACSPYFETIFKSHEVEHPVVILKGICRKEMKCLIDYMYVGSLEVSEDELPSLLTVANELQIKGKRWFRWHRCRSIQQIFNFLRKIKKYHENSQSKRLQKDLVYVVIHLIFSFYSVGCKWCN